MYVCRVHMGFKVSNSTVTPLEFDGLEAPFLNVVWLGAIDKFITTHAFALGGSPKYAKKAEAASAQVK